MSRNEYTGGSELVPSGLRVYRHYRISGGLLGATITTNERFPPGVSHAKCYATRVNHWGWNSTSLMGCMRCGGAGIVRRMRPKPMQIRPSDIFASDDISPTPMDVEVYDEACECQRGRRVCSAPNADCTCGFYASYDPRTNFFDEVKKNGTGWMYGRLPEVFAVVEASGRVLMGSKGVRAEKMEIKAIALDAEHIADTHGQAAAARYYGVDNEYVRNILISARTPYRDLARLADTYRVPSFGDDIDAMIREFPQPDLSHLIKNQEK